MSNNTQRQHYLHQEAAGMHKIKTYVKSRQKLQRFTRQNSKTGV